MQLARYIRDTHALRTERDEARQERDAARRVIADQTEYINVLREQLSQAEAAHSAAIADLDAIIAAANERGEVITYAKA